MSTFNSNFTQSYFKNTDRNSPKKKKRKHSDINNYHDSTSINVFDRVLDFSKYKSNTVLYVLCRDWINATTSVSSSQRHSKHFRNDFNDINFDLNNQIVNNTSGSNSVKTLNSAIKSLPAPVDIKTENVEILKKKTCNFDLNELINGEKNELLKNNLARWKNVRKESIKNFHAENSRYKESYDILKNIYENN